MKMRLMVLFLSLFVWQHSQAQGDDWHFHHINVQNGLSEATNFHTFKDSRGFVWISSISGLNRFDGRQVRVYQPDLADSTAIFGQNIQSNFFEDAQGDIWFSTYEGINRYIRQKDCFEHFILKNKDNQAVSSYKVGHLDAEGHLWLLIDEETVYLFDVKTHVFQRLHTVKKGMQCLVVSASATVKRSFAYSWNAGREGFQMTTYLPNGQMSTKTVFDKTTKDPLSIYDLSVESDTLVWLVTDKKGIVVFNPETLSLQTTEKNIDAPNVLSAKGKAEFLVSTRFNGVHVFDKKTKQYRQHFRHNSAFPNSLAGNAMSNIYQDADGVVWANYADFGEKPFVK